MGKQAFLSLIVLFSFSLSGYCLSGNDEVLIQINGRTITKSEFISVFEKNRMDEHIIDANSIEEYLELYINFNLKVIEAVSQGMDTSQAFINELNSYRQQLAAPYLNDKVVTESLIEEAYERMKYEIRASHILISLPEHALPDDSLKAYRRAERAKERALRGDDFERLALEISEDPSAKGMPATPDRGAVAGNKGDLGYFTVFNMTYPFETMAYNTAVGEISEIVRSSFGYHIIKVTDRIPAMGRINAAHIMAAVHGNATDEQEQEAENKINEIYQKLMDGEDFARLVRQFSDDKGSADRDGKIPVFSANRIFPEVVEAIAALEEGEVYTKPFRTVYGWHVFKVHEISGIASYEDMYPEIANNVARDQRSFISQDTVINRLKEEYSFVENIKELNPFYAKVNNSIFEGSWEKDALGDYNDLLLSFAGMEYTQQDFANYLFDNQIVRSPESLHSYITGRYIAFVNETILDYENTKLEDKYPEFSLIMKEYHDGILLFELTDKVVWTKAMNDTIGLEEFFNKNQDNYIWEERINATIYQCSDKEIANELRKDVRRANRRGKDKEDILSKYNTNSLLAVSAAEGLYKRRDHPVLNEIEWEKGVTDVIEFDDSFFVINVSEHKAPEPKKLNEVRGLVIADYQTHLEEKWIESLKSKYNIVVNQDVLNDIIENYK